MNAFQPGSFQRNAFQMTPEQRLQQRLQQILGAQIFELALQATQLEAAQARIAALEKPMGPGENQG